MKIAIAQINTTVGDFAGNESRIRAAYDKGAAMGMDLVVFPETTLTGYPPRDLLLRRSFVEANLALLERLAAGTGKTAMILGFVGRNTVQPGRELTNSVALLHEGKIVATRSKTLLPTYDVFDEDRYFEPAPDNLPVEWKGRRLGLTICEDVWNDEDYWDERRYRRNPVAELADAGADLILNCSASPWHLGKDAARRDMLARLAAKTKTPLIYCNLVGGNDELVFDGGSLAFDARGGLLAEGRPFEEDFTAIDTGTAPVLTPGTVPDEERLFKALVLGTRDYLHKCGFRSAVLGLSGGIDSALTAVIACEALGRDNVFGVSMPTQFSSQGSLDDARILAHNLGIRYEVVPIQPAFESVKNMLRPVFVGRPEDVTEENIQARLRGLTLMALSNKFGAMVLTTGNKSENAVGYATLYGDMCGGLAVISDLSKMTVYALSRWINRNGEVIPAASITKPPSAELRPNQTDQDSLPPYEMLDAILEEYVVRGRSAAEIVARGFDRATVERVARMTDLAEYKRRQAAPGLKVTTKAFGIGRRIPIAQRYRGG